MVYLYQSEFIPATYKETDKGFQIIEDEDQTKVPWV